MKNFVLYLWQLLQNLVGLCILVFLKIRKYPIVIEEYKGIKVFFVKGFPGGISLGKYIILNSKSTRIDVKHEYGHTVQSKWLGPLYLIVIGLPSIIHAELWKWCGYKWNYYSFATERNADQLGGVKR